MNRTKPPCRSASKSPPLIRLSFTVRRRQKLIHRGIEMIAENVVRAVRQYFEPETQTKNNGNDDKAKSRIGVRVPFETVLSFRPLRAGPGPKNAPTISVSVYSRRTTDVLVQITGMLHGYHDVAGPVQNQRGRSDLGQRAAAQVSAHLVQRPPERVDPEQRFFRRVPLAVRLERVPPVTVAPVPDVGQRLEEFDVLLGDERVAAPHHESVHAVRRLGRRDERGHAAAARAQQRVLVDL